jgi:hypothetical protein
MRLLLAIVAVVLLTVSCGGYGGDGSTGYAPGVFSLTIPLDTATGVTMTPTLASLRVFGSCVQATALCGSPGWTSD